jgi:hypothetical protein
MIGLGVAGNFTGHLEQAGEAKDFLDIYTEHKNAPKGIFPFYVPNAKNFLNVFPLSSSTIVMSDKLLLQPEPEVALLCTLIYEDNRIKTIIPKYFAAYNDCSIRTDATKISKKKNWGENTKGLSDKYIPIDRFTTGGVMDNYNLVCFLKRNNTIFLYGENSEIRTYSYFYKQLLTWLIDRINSQRDYGPLENIHDYIEIAGYPSEAIVSIGATRYTEFGKKTYVQRDDEIFIIVYHRTFYSFKAIEKLVEEGKIIPQKRHISVLHQKVA